MTTITVSSPADLLAALAKAAGGDTVALAVASYDGLLLKDFSFSPPVTITSADPSQPAVLTNFDTWRCAGLTFRGVGFMVLSPAWVGFNVYSSQGVTLDGVHVHGSLDGDSSNDAEGFRFFDSADIVVRGSHFEQLNKGAQFAKCSRVTATGNHLHDLISAAFVFAGRRPSERRRQRHPRHQAGRWPAPRRHPVHHGQHHGLGA
jgi:hypothetical protein